MRKVIDIGGKRFGSLTALAHSSSDKGHAIWTCLCDCGRYIDALSFNLRNGRTKSCGCKKKEYIASKIKTHGMKKTPEYAVWCAMIRRCYNPNVIGYENYGGRGIKVCDKWKNSFALFYIDMGDRPSQKHTIGRIDNNIEYCKTNCRWETHKEQNNNRRDNILVTDGKRVFTLAQMVELLNLDYGKTHKSFRKGVFPDGFRIFQP